MGEAGGAGVVGNGHLGAVDGNADARHRVAVGGGPQLIRRCRGRSDGHRRFTLELANASGNHRGPLRHGQQQAGLIDRRHSLVTGDPGGAADQQGRGPVDANAKRLQLLLGTRGWGGSVRLNSDRYEGTAERTPDGQEQPHTGDAGGSHSSTHGRLHGR